MAKPKVPVVSPETLFSPDEVAELISNAMMAVCNPAWGGVVLPPKRLAYVRNFAQVLLERLQAQDVSTGHLSPQEGVAMLLGAALVLQKLHGGK